VADSAFGCAGQRCLATSVAIAVGDAAKTFPDLISDAAASRKVGNGLDAGIEMGPVITAESKKRIEALLAGAERDGVKTRVGGMKASVPGGGNFIAPTILEDTRPDAEIARSEVFGPVLSVMRVKTIDDAIDYINASAYGNM